VPALDPSGQPIEESVPRVLRIRGQERDVPPVDVGEISGRPEPDSLEPPAATDDAGGGQEP
jgi:NADH-quinone oxidoreductase subunit J